MSHDFLEDLSLVQGWAVPANIEQTQIGAHDRPSSSDLSDSNASGMGLLVENPHQLCTDFKYPPQDVGLTEEMLDLVIDNDVSLDEVTQHALPINKTSNVSEKKKVLSPRIVTKNERKPDKRNVALQSKLLKPDNSVSTNMDETVEKVNVHSSKKHTANKKSYVVFEPGNMFRKKTAKSPKESHPSPQTDQVQKTIEIYKPSIYADYLYNIFMERDMQRLKKCVKHETIWSKAERQMKEIDEKRRRDAYGWMDM